MNLTEATVLCLDAWRAEVLAGRARPDWRPPSALLNGVLGDADAFAFVRDVFDYVALPSDAFTAALGLTEVAHTPPESLPRHLRYALRVGGIASLGLPWGVVPLVKQRFRAHLRDLLVSGALPGPPPEGTSTTIAPLGAPVFGPESVEAELSRLLALIQSPGWLPGTGLALTLSRLMPEFNAWSSDTTAERLLELAGELLETCSVRDIRVTVSAHSYAEAMLMPSLVRAVTGVPGLARLRFGVELLAELPETPGMVRDITSALAENGQRERRLPRAHPVELVLTTRSVVAAETIRSLEQGLAVPSVTESQARDRLWVEALDVLLPVTGTVPSEPPAGSAPVAVVVATEDPTLIAMAQVLMQQRQPGRQLTVELVAGRATELEQALQRTGVGVRRRVTHVPNDEVAHGYPVVLETLAAIAAPASAFALANALWGEHAPWPETVATQRERVMQATTALQMTTASQASTALQAPALGTQRLQDRGREWQPSEQDSPLMYRPPTEALRFDTGGLTAQVMRLHHDGSSPLRLHAERAQRVPVVSDSGFACEPDTDAVQTHNRAWVRARLTRAGASRIGVERARSAQLGLWALEPVMQRALAGGTHWSTWTHDRRATIVRRAALALVAARDRFIEVIASERGAPVPLIDHEIGYAIDSARYLASRAEGLRTVRGATFTPSPLTLVVADAQVGFGELTEALVAALAAGSGVVLLAHERLSRQAAVLDEELSEAGLPPHTVTLVTPTPGEEFGDLVLRVIERDEPARGLFLIGSELAARLRHRNPALQRDVRVHSVGTVVVTPSADLTAAVPDIVRSAFAAGGPAHSVSAVIWVGPSVASRAFQRALADSVRGVNVGRTGAEPERVGESLSYTLGPLPEPPSDAGLRALTVLEPGETWLVQPRRLSDDGTLWSPGVRAGVQADSTFWRDAIGVPVIGVTTAHSLSDAIDKQHRIGGGRVAALHSLSDHEIIPWLEHSRAASLSVNRATSGARVERHPGGVWHSEQSSWQPLAAGPNRLTPLGNWKLRTGTRSDTLHLRGLDPLVRRLIESVQPIISYQEFDVLRRAALADELAWRTQFGVVRDGWGLSTERNLMRYRGVAVHLRLAEGAEFISLVRLIAAATLTATPITVSVGHPLPEALTRVLDAQAVAHSVIDDERWLELASVRGSAVSGEGAMPAERIRLIGGDAVRVTEWLRSRDDVSLWGGPVTMAGPIEMLSFFREQHLSINLTRHGMLAPNEAIEGWITELTRG